MGVLNADEIERWIVHRIAEVLAVPPENVDRVVPLDELGLDSISRVALTVELEILLRKKIRPEVALSYDTVRALAEFLATLPT